MKDPKMECTLTLKNNKANVGDYPSAELEIKNISKENLVIKYSSRPSYYLQLLIFDPAGKEIPNGPYRNLFSLIDERQITLRPGESHREGIAICATSDPARWKEPGTYKITAIYEYNKEKAVSKQVELTLTPK